MNQAALDEAMARAKRLEEDCRHATTEAAELRLQMVSSSSEIASEMKVGFAKRLAEMEQTMKV